MTLAVQNLTLTYYDKTLLHNVSLEIESGKTTILFGKSGSGKTLSTLAMQGILPSNITQKSGTTLLNGKEIAPHSLPAKVCANIMQNPRTCFNPLFTLHRHIKESARALKTSWDKEEIESILHEVGLEKEVLRFYPFEMSGGMLQRAMIALALLTKAPFLIADEPTTDLDILVQHRILKLLKAVQKSHNLGILLITHDRNVALTLGDTFFIIDSGVIQQKFSLQEIIAQETMKERGLYTQTARDFIEYYRILKERHAFKG